MVQSRAKRIKNEIQKIKKTLKDLNMQIFIKDFDLTEAEDLLDELEDEAFWLCTARAEKHKGIEMW